MAGGLEKLIGLSVPVLDSGYVRVIDIMGGDHSIVQAARISYGAGTKTLRADRGLIRYLMRHRHTSPFEMCEIKLHVRVPMDCWRQWIRHRTANVNEYSTRYSVAIDDAQLTKATEWRTQGLRNRQGSGEYLPVEVGDLLSRREQDLHDRLREEYKFRLEKGVAREQARKDLPLSTFTEAYWKIDLHNLLHFLELRLSPLAQVEIREYARSIAQVVCEWVPITWEAFVDYRLSSVTFGRREFSALAGLISVGAVERKSALVAADLWDQEKDRPTREGEEFLAKISQVEEGWEWES